MALNADDRNELKSLFRRLTDEALRPGDPLYEPLYETPLDGDPVSLMLTHIDFSFTESIQLFSGFRGTGKTTELLRLREKLEIAGDFVVFADALDYVNPAEPVEISDLLMALAGAFSDQLEAQLGGNLGSESFWTRLKTFILSTEVSPKEVGVDLSYESPAKELVGGLKAGVDIKFELKSGSSFRNRLQKFLSARLKDLKSQVDSFLEAAVVAIRAARGPDTRIVFIFDQLEQMRGTLEREEEVIRSVERIFSIHIDMLKLPYVHTVYTAPPWLKFRVSPMVRHTILPTIHLWRNNENRSRDEPCWKAYRSLVHRRLGDDGLRFLFDAPSSGEHPLVDRLIEMSGGQIRDLLRLFREGVLRATALNALPVTKDFVEGVVNAVRSDFLPIALDDAKWLDQIGRIRSTALPSTDAEPVNRLSRFLDNHSVLFFRNGEEWYDLHPLVRDDVAKVVGVGSVGLS